MRSGPNSISTAARDRAGVTMDDLLSKFPKLKQWESGEIQPALKQIERYAKASHAPVGYFFLPEPPEEPLPLSDFRTLSGRGVRPASPILRDMIHACQERQDWFRDNARMSGADRLAFVGSANLQSPIVETAAAMRRALYFDLERRRTCATWPDALRCSFSRRSPRYPGDVQRHRDEQHPSPTRSRGVPWVRAVGRSCAAGVHQRGRYEIGTNVCLGA